MRTKKELCTLAKVLNLLAAPKRLFALLSTVESRTCKQGSSANFLVPEPFFYPSRTKKAAELTRAQHLWHVGAECFSYHD